MNSEMENIVGRWVHVHEEDDEEHRVFRRVGVPLPPSRGRTELVISPDLQVQSSGPGPDDRQQGGGVARVTFGAATVDRSTGERLLRVSDVTADRLRILKD